MNGTVIYTSIFGGYDGLIPQKRIDGVDFVCFTDQYFNCEPWKVVQYVNKSADNNRAAKEFKILPHKYLSEYKQSIWIDGNFIVKREIDDLLWQLSLSPFVAFKHGLDCIYDEYENIIRLGQSTGKYKDDPEIMKAQMDRYRKEGFPAHYGLTQNNVLIRNHNDPLVIQTMELWWNEIRNGSKRDQLSLFYSIWKTGLQIRTLPHDSRSCEWFYMLGAHRGNYKWKYLRYAIKSKLGLLRKYDL
jgi:hypothetical protein